MLELGWKPRTHAESIKDIAAGDWWRRDENVVPRVGSRVE
jgi:hypothetical protein